MQSHRLVPNPVRCPDVLMIGNGERQTLAPSPLLWHGSVMGRLGREVYRRKLARFLSHSDDETVIALIASITATLAGNEAARRAVPDLPPEALGAELGSPWHIPPWTLETLINELLAIPKMRSPKNGRIRTLDATRFSTLRVVARSLVKLENAEDGIFLDRHDVFYEMARIAQRQFPWQRGAINAPSLYRAMVLYGSETASEHFEAKTGLAVSDFVKMGFYLSGAFTNNEFVRRSRDLSQLKISRGMRDAALAKFAIEHREARRRAASMRAGHRHTAYSPSLLRDFPIIAFGPQGGRLRAPLPDLIALRYTTGLYLDVVDGGPSVWTGIGERFETYALEYLQAMMSPYGLSGEREYGFKKARYRTPDILVSDAHGIVAVIECKAKRMSFDARYADDPLHASAAGFDELAKGVFQLWRFFAHARRGLFDERHVAPDCQGILMTADGWLALASRQAESVIAAAHTLADKVGDIEAEDRREIAFAPIEDVEYALQHGTGESFLEACRAIVSNEKRGFQLSIAHRSTLDEPRDYPFVDRLETMLPWLRDDGR